MKIYLKIKTRKTYRYDIVAGDPNGNPANGKAKETLGTYEPRSNEPDVITLDIKRYDELVKVKQEATPTRKVAELAEEYRRHQKS